MPTTQTTVMTRSFVKRVGLSCLARIRVGSPDRTVFVSPAVVEELKRIIRDSEITKSVGPAEARAVYTSTL